MDALLYKILLKRGIRSDTFWLHPTIFKSALILLPLFLDTVALMRSQYWPRERLDHLQLMRATDLIRDAQRVPYWRSLLKENKGGNPLCIEDALRKIPITTKQDLQLAHGESIRDAALLTRSNPDRTSGSTGRPFRFFFDWGASLRSYAVTERIFRSAGRGVRYPILYVRSRPRNGFTFWKHEWIRSLGHRDIPSTMNNIASAVRHNGGNCILYAYTSSMIEIARRAPVAAPSLALRAAVVAGEHLTADSRLLIESALKTEVFTLYASREAGFLAFECEHHALHIAEEWAYLEIVDENGESCAPGAEGRVIVTTFDNRVMPFIRYDTGDRGLISDRPCVCGRTLRTIVLKGRTAELIALDKGRLVSLLDVSSTIDRFWHDVRQFQLLQHDPVSFTLRIVPTGAVFDDVPLRTALLEILGRHVALSIEITEKIEQAKSGKAVYFVRAARRQ